MNTIENFINLSAVLTGYKAIELKPKNDTQQVAQKYFDTLTKNTPVDVLNDLYNTFLNIKGDITDGVLEQILQDATLGQLARNIIQMWYTGIWYGLYPGQMDYVISSTAYTNGLVWKEMGAHPMGFSEGNFGYWADAPQMPVIK
ncbi:MAG: sugar dehydrogenase complex small subunit [Bacteroidota bacterium]